MLFHHNQFLLFYVCLIWRYSPRYTFFHIFSLIEADEDEVITSEDGDDFEINSSGGRRQKRDVVDDFDLSIKSSGGKT